MVYSSGKNLVYAFHNYKPYTLNSPLYLGVPAIAVGLSAISLLAFCFLLTQKSVPQSHSPFPVPKSRSLSLTQDMDSALRQAQ